MKLSDKKSSGRSFYVYLAVISFALNWVWEIAQMSAYRTAEKSWGEALFLCTFATVVDVLAVVAIYGAATVLFGRRGWKFYLTTSLLGAVSVVVFEKVAFAFGWWSYNKQMPVVPVIGIGILPFMQLVILAPLSVWLAVRWRERRTANLRIGGNENG